jgi:hypothetical protein
MGDMRNMHNVSVGKSEAKKLFGRPAYRWEDNNMKMDLREITLCVDMIHFTQDRYHWWALVNIPMDLQVHKRRGIS